MTINSRKAIVAGIIGNTIEWYDFALYGHFSLIIGQTFFPEEAPELATLAAFAVFSVSFFMRPLGALIFSHIGDRYGRKKALSLSMLGMAIPTFGIGLLPAFHDIGLAATLLLICLRLFQGLALGGEMGGAVTYIMEHTPRARIGLASSLIQASTCLGLLAGTVISSLISLTLTESEFQAWGWRAPFLLGLLAAWIGLRIRRNMPESTLYENAKAEDRLHKSPIRTLLRSHKGKIVTGLILLIPMTFSFFFAFVYYNSFMMGQLHFPVRQALMTTSAGLLLSLAVTIGSGWLADRVGYKRLLVVGAILLLAGALPMTRMLSGGQSEAEVMSGLLVFAVLIGVYTSAAFAAVAGLFTTELRYSGVSFAINIASPVFGSTAPLLAAWLIHDLGVEPGFHVVGYYLMALCLLALLAILRLDHAAFDDWNPDSRPETPDGESIAPEA